MGEYWYYRPGFEERAKEFFSNKQDPVFTQSFVLKERDFVNAGNASSTIKLDLKRIGVEPTILRRVAIAGYEAEINSTAHAKGGEIFCNVYPDLVHIIFHDFGPGMADIEQSMVPGFSTADEQVREMGFGAGLGLPNIKKNSDTLHITSEAGGRTFLEILIYFKNEEK